MKLEDLKPAPYNPRNITPKAAGGLVTSLAEFGDISGIVWNSRTGNLVSGHQRVSQLLSVGAQLLDGALTATVRGELRRFPVRVVDWSLGREKAANVAANNPAIGGEFTDGLGELLREIEGEMGATGFGALNLDTLLGDLGDLVVTATDAVGGDEPAVPPELEDLETPEPPAVPETQPGDLWELGDHRLLCGDSTKVDDVTRLLDGTLASLMFTDPPYGVAYGSAKKNAIVGDLSGASIPLSMAIAINDALDGDARIYLCGGSNNFDMYSKLFDHYLRSQCRIIVWDKGHFVLRPLNYHSQFEIIYWGWKGSGGSANHWYGDRKQRDIWPVKLDPDRKHPTQKPVELPAKAISNSCPPNGVVYDPFLGSGTTLIAAEQLGRKCYGLEIDPRFCDVIVARWEELTGGTATRERVAVV